MKIECHTVCLVCTSVTCALFCRMVSFSTYFIADFSVIVTFLRLRGEEKGASGHLSLQEHERHL